MYNYLDCTNSIPLCNSYPEMKDNRKKLIFNRGLKKACDEAGSGKSNSMQEDILLFYF